MLLTGDLGFTVARAVRRALPGPLLQRRRRRAEHGRRWRPGSPRRASCPFVYSIATFASLRPVRVHPQRPGPSPPPGAHRRRRRRRRLRPQRDHALTRSRTSRVMRAQPGMTVVAPADADQARAALRATAALPGPGLLPARQGRRRASPGSTAASSSAAPSVIARRRATSRSSRSARSPARRSRPRRAARRARRRRDASSSSPASARARSTTSSTLLGRDAPSRSRSRRTTSTGGLGSLVAEVDRRARPRLPPACAPAWRDAARRSPAAQRLPRTSATASARRRIVRGRSRRQRGPARRPDARRARRSSRAVIACYRDAPAVPIMHERLVADVRRSSASTTRSSSSTTARPTTPREVLAELAAARPEGRRRSTTPATSARRAPSRAGCGSPPATRVVLLDGDLQDPPELIAEFVEQWREGYDVVYGERVKREAPLPMQLALQGLLPRLPAPRLRRRRRSTPATSA